MTTTKFDCTFHQLAPYIGRMKTSMARSLVLRWTSPGDLIVDPFCGCGVVALEAVGNDRAVAVGDWNPYAVLLTRAKLFAPKKLETAERRLTKIWKRSRELLPNQDLRKVPSWVREFFHPETLRSALAFRDACVESKDDFLLACLLGILHHQRPGFLSYPSSHLVPYLRTRKFPRLRHAHLYDERDVLPRLLAKVRRTYRRPPTSFLQERRVLHVDARRFPKLNQVGAIITSPPYMNELDYVRDNRLRLWFIRRELPAGIELSGRNRENAFRELMRDVSVRLAPQVKPGGAFVLVVGDATRGNGKPGKTAAITKSLFSSDPMLSEFKLEEIQRDRIPDIRRSRRECSGTKVETILVYRKQVRLVQPPAQS